MWYGPSVKSSCGLFFYIMPIYFPVFHYSKTFYDCIIISLSIIGCQFCWDILLHLWSCGFVDNPYPYTFRWRLCYYNLCVILWENHYIARFLDGPNFLLQRSWQVLQSDLPCGSGCQKGTAITVVILAAAVPLELYLYVNAITKALKN